MSAESLGRRMRLLVAAPDGAETGGDVGTFTRSGSFDSDPPGREPDPIEGKVPKTEEFRQREPTPVLMTFSSIWR